MAVVVSGKRVREGSWCYCAARLLSPLTRSFHLSLGDPKFPLVVEVEKVIFNYKKLKRRSATRSVRLSA